MATLAESFLADLEELDDEGEFEAEEAGAAGAVPSGIGLADALNYDDLDSVAPLVHSERYRSILQVRPQRSSRAASSAALMPFAVPRSASTRRFKRATSRACARGLSTKTRSTRCAVRRRISACGTDAFSPLAADCGLQRTHGRHRQRGCARAQLHSRQVRARTAAAPRRRGA